MYRYTIGSVGFCDVDCDFLDYTYVQLNSNELSQRVNQDVLAFAEGLKASDCNKVKKKLVLNHNFFNFFYPN